MTDPSDADDIIEYVEYVFEIENGTDMKVTPDEENSSDKTTGKDIQVDK